MPCFHHCQGVFLQAQQLIDRGRGSRADPCRLSQIVGLVHAEEFLEGRIHCGVTPLGILGRDGLRQAGQQRLLQHEFIGKAHLGLPPSPFLLAQAQMADHENQDDQAGQCERRPVSGQQHSP
ncbi:hypothetical protein D3C80_1390310 [compost metagenome]